MPGFDRSGPMGQGPRTGGARGLCGGGQGAGQGRGGRGLGLGFRGNRGRGPGGNMAWGRPVGTVPAEAAAVQDDTLNALQNTLEQINQRLTALEKAKTGE